MQCKKSEVVTIENATSFYMDLKNGCDSKSGNNQERDDLECIMKKELLLCYRQFQKVESSQVDKIFNDTKWSVSDKESIHYFVDRGGNISIFEGGPSDTEYEAIGKGRIYKVKSSWVYEQSCQPGKCEDFSFPIEYLSCDASFHPSDSEYHMSLTIGNRYYDFLDANKNEKHISLEYDGTIKPQIRNGFELYLVPPPPK